MLLGAAYTAPSASGTGTCGVIVRGASDANLLALELSNVDDAMQTIYQEGGKATVMMTSPANKRKFSAKAQAADSNVQRNIDDSGKLRQSVEMYDSVTLVLSRIVPNYIMGSSS